MSQRKNKIGRGTLILSLTSFLFFLVLAIWAFSQHGTWGLYNWNHDYRRLLNIIIGLGFLVPAVALILWLLRGVVSRTWFKVGSWILNIVSVVVIVVCIGIVFYVVVPAYSLLSLRQSHRHRCKSGQIWGWVSFPAFLQRDTAR